MHVILSCTKHHSSAVGQRIQVLCWDACMQAYLLPVAARLLAASYDSVKPLHTASASHPRHHHSQREACSREFSSADSRQAPSLACQQLLRSDASLQAQVRTVVHSESAARQTSSQS